MKNRYLLSSSSALLAISILVLLAGCNFKAPGTAKYDYYYYSHQSLFLHQNAKKISSMYLSIPDAYEVLNIKLSPSKKYLAFSAMQDQQQVLFLANSDGSEMKRLHQALEITFEWSPVKDQLAMIERNINSSMFYLAKHEVDQLVLISEADSFTWSPHGLYLCISKKENLSHILQLIRNDGTGLRYVSQGDFLDWSYDGQFIYVIQYGTLSNKLQVYQYEALLHDEFEFKSSDKIEVHHSENKKNSLFSYTLEHKRVFEYYDPHEKTRVSIEKANILDFVESNNAVNPWELSIRFVNQGQELVFHDGSEDQVISQGERIYFASISLDESKVIAIVQNGTQKSIQVIDTSNKTWDIIASGESIGDLSWHKDSSRLALNLDHKTLLIVFDQNLSVTTLDDINFLTWKES
jgi:Tol biopolymer transport system component